MNRRVLPIVLLAALCVPGCQTADNFTTGGQDIPSPIGKTQKWSFDGNSVGELPADFISVLGVWSVAAEGSAPLSPNVLRQTGSYGNPDFPRVLVKDLTFANLKMKVRCRPESGSIDQACGLIFRAMDSDNYYITRANALERSVNLYRVVARSRQIIAEASAQVTQGQWHTLEATVVGAQITITWDGTPMISVMDQTYTNGKIGLWTKADSVTAFDDLEATAQ